MREHLSPGIFFYAPASLTSYHFGNGLFGFAIHWGRDRSAGAAAGGAPGLAAGLA